MDTKITRQQIDAAKQANPGAELHLLDALGHQAIAKAPPREQYEFFKTEASHKQAGRALAALETLVKGCVVTPDAAGLEKMLDKFPGLVESYGNALIKLAGLTEEATAKKL